MAYCLVNHFFFNQGRQFKSFVIKEICKFLHIHKTRTSSYHPQCNSVVEHFNGTLLATTAKYNPSNWEEYISTVCFTYNTSIHSSTDLMYGRDARHPVDLTFQIRPSNPPTSIPEYVQRLLFHLQYAYNLVHISLDRNRFMTERYMVNLLKVRWYGYTQQLFLQTVVANYTIHTLVRIKL